MTVDERQSGPARLVTTNFTFIRFHLIGLRVRRVCPSWIKHGGRASILFNCVERLMKAEATETAFDVDWIVRLVGDRYRQRPSFFTSSLLRSLLFPLACRWPSDWYQLAVLWTFFIFIFSFFFSFSTTRWTRKRETSCCAQQTRVFPYENRTLSLQLVRWFKGHLSTRIRYLSALLKKKKKKKKENKNRKKKNESIGHARGKKLSWGLVPPAATCW